MANPIRFHNARILVKDSTSNGILADSTTGTYDPYTNLIKIPISSITFRENCSVLVQIFTEDNVYEYSGRMHRAVVANEIEIALFSGRSKNLRKYKRSKIDAHGLIEGIILDSQTVILRKPITITAMNISRNGLRIQAMAGSLEVGNAFVASLDVPGRQFRYEYQVVSVHNSNLETEEYGCRIFQPE